MRCRGRAIRGSRTRSAGSSARRSIVSSADEPMRPRRMFEPDLFRSTSFARTRAFWRLITPIRSLLLRRKRAGLLVGWVLDGVPPLQDAVRKLVAGNPQNRYQAWIEAYDTLGDADLVAMDEELSRFDERPLLSVIAPLAGANEELLEALTESLLVQVYERWELLFFGASPGGDGVLSRLADAPSRDERFRLLARPAPPVADEWDAVLRSAAGEFV